MKRGLTHACARSDFFSNVDLESFRLEKSLPNQRDGESGQKRRCCTLRQSPSNQVGSRVRFLSCGETSPWWPLSHEMWFIAQAGVRTPECRAEAFEIRFGRDGLGLNGLVPVWPLGDFPLPNGDHSIPFECDRVDRASQRNCGNTWGCPDEVRSAFSSL